MANEKIIKLAELLNQAELELIGFDAKLEKERRLDIVKLYNSRLKVANYYNTTFKGMIEKPFCEEVQHYYNSVSRLVHKACVFSEGKE